MVDLLHHIGLRLRTARENADMSIEQAASAVLISARLLENYEAGEGNVPVLRLDQLARAYKVSSVWLSHGDEGDHLTNSDLHLVSRNEWGALTEDEQRFVKDTLGDARQLLKRRRQLPLSGSVRAHTIFNKQNGSQRQPISEKNRVDVKERIVAIEEEKTRFLLSVTTVIALVLLGVVVILSDRYGARVWGITTALIVGAGAFGLRYQAPRRILAAAAAEWLVLDRWRGVFRRQIVIPPEPSSEALISILTNRAKSGADLFESPQDTELATVGDDDMPSLDIAPIEEARGKSASRRKRSQILQEYQGYIDQLKSGEAGKLVASAGETTATVRRRIGAAARESRKNLTIKRAGDEVFFWVEGRRSANGRRRKG